MRRQILEEDSADDGTTCYVQEYAGGGDVGDYTHPLQVLEEAVEEEVGDVGNKYDKANDLVHYQEIYQETNIYIYFYHQGGSYQ